MKNHKNVIDKSKYLKQHYFIEINLFSILGKTVEEKLKQNALVEFINFPCK